MNPIMRLLIRAEYFLMFYSFASKDLVIWPKTTLESPGMMSCSIFIARVIHNSTMTPHTPFVVSSCKLIFQSYANSLLSGLSSKNLALRCSWPVDPSTYKPMSSFDLAFMSLLWVLRQSLTCFPPRSLLVLVPARNDGIGNQFGTYLIRGPI